MKSIQMQSLAILLVVGFCSVNMVQSLQCYVCTYTSAAGSDSQNCQNPTSSTPTQTCNYTSAACTKSVGTATSGGVSVTAVVRLCSPSVGSTGCQATSGSFGTGTGCFCETDLCNDGPTVHVRPGLRHLLITFSVVVAAVLV